MSADPHDPFVLAHLRYLRECGMSHRTVYQRNRSLIRLQMVLPVPLIEATAQMLAAWRSGLTCGEEAVKHYVGDARQFYAWAVDQGLRDDNPAARLPVPRIGRRLPRPISEEDLFTALSTTPDDPRVRPSLVLAAYAGLRAKEIAFLRRQHVLETDKLLLIVHDATKGHGERIIPMSDFVIDELRAYGLPKFGFVFARGDKRPGPNTPHIISLQSNTYLHDLGITATLQQLRHRFGTMMYRLTKDLRLVQELMGHKDPKTTAGYAAWDQSQASAMVEDLPVPRRLKSVS